ncbi:MAG: hypothetical protein HC802_05170 [Caldilineaceae bacterium]|nr:hypothetical protein [Caldilineaceae bacterium]
MSRERDVALQLLQNESLVDKVLRMAQESPLGNAVPTNDDKLEFRLDFAEYLVEETDFGTARRAYQDHTKVHDKARLMAKLGIMKHFTDVVSAESKRSVAKSPELAPERRFLGPDLNLQEAGKKFMEERQNVKLNQAYLTPQEMGPFAAALKDLPTVKFLLEEGQSKNDVTPSTAKRADWKDGGSLDANIKEVNDLWKSRKVFNSIFDRKRAQKRLKSRTFRARVGTVDRMMKAIIAPEILTRINKPEIHVHATASQGAESPWGFRAYASGGKQLHVAYDEATNVIAHEVGHIVEKFLPTEVFHDMHLLLSARHLASGGGTARKGATPIFTTFGEGRYAGKYVTGKYTSTAYKSGNAEVFSMAMEFFSSPADALKLIEGDPLHAAIILRGIKPDEYKAVDKLRAFDKFLPHE